jgi:hypothetical protein
MIVVVEGPSGAGKTTWVAGHHRPAAVWEYMSEGGEPDRDSDPDGAARFWAEASARRWQQALETESEHGMAVCDTDPFKLHYVWGLWRLGEASTSAWMTEARANREKFGAGRLGLADLILCDIFPTPLSCGVAEVGTTAGLAANSISTPDSPNLSASGTRRSTRTIRDESGGSCRRTGRSRIHHPHGPIDPIRTCSTSSSTHCRAGNPGPPRSPNTVQ